MEDPICWRNLCAGKKIEIGDRRLYSIAKKFQQRASKMMSGLAKYFSINGEVFKKIFPPGFIKKKHLV